jgi:hypothetical protein
MTNSKRQRLEEIKKITLITSPWLNTHEALFSPEMESNILWLISELDEAWQREAQMTKLKDLERGLAKDLAKDRGFLKLENTRLTIELTAALEREAKLQVENLNNMYAADQALENNRVLQAQVDKLVEALEKIADESLDNVACTALEAHKKAKGGT